MNNKAPLVYFYGLTPGVYEATYPVFIVGEEAAEHTFVVAIDDARMTDQETPEFGVAENSESTRRRYITSSVQRRLHQRAFSFRVLRAYHHSCAMCRLRREALVDAAHILPDKHPKGEPWVSNGLALCKLHHAAFDEDLLGVRPDLVIEVRSDVLKEKDGPMLMHGLQEMHNRPLVVLPSAKNERPRAEFLEERYHRFRSTA